MNRWIAMAPAEGGRLPERIPFEDGAYERLSCGAAQAWFQRDGKFGGDQLFAAGDQGFLISDGVLLNLTELKAEYGTEDLSQVVRRGWEENDGAFFKRFAGPFCGCCYERESDTLTAYANQTGDTMVFTYCAEGCRMASNDLNMIEAVMEANGFPRTLDETAMLHLMSFGFMVEERTAFREIKRVFPGELVKLKGGERRRTVYHRFSFHPRELSFQEAVEQVDAGFKKAVRRCQEKDREYGARERLTDLSGGLDSRMTAWAAHELGYGPAVYISYSQSTSDEIRFASRVARELGGQLFFKQMDDANFLYEVDRLVNENYGLSVFFGITGGEQFLRTLNAERFGLEHTGQIGDAVVGTLVDRAVGTIQEAQHTLKYSQTVSCSLPDGLLEGYENFEAFAMYTRAFLGALSSHVIRRNYFYTVSPFMDPDFLSLCMSIPVEYRQEHKLYWAWLDAKYPEAAKLPSTRLRPETPFAKRVRLARKKLRRKLQLLRDPDAPPNHMNPTDYWYRTKPDLRQFMAEYYQENRPLLDRYPETAERVDRMYASPKSMDKLLAIDVLAVAKRYFPAGK